MIRCVTPSPRWPRFILPRRRLIGDESSRWENHPSRVFNFGAPGLDQLYGSSLLTRPQLERELGFPAFNDPVALVTYHPVTRDAGSAERPSSLPGGRNQGERSQGGLHHGECRRPGRADQYPFTRRLCRKPRAFQMDSPSRASPLPQLSQAFCGHGGKLLKRID